MDIGARVRQARDRLGISQNELARQTGLTSATISRIEAGKRTPDGETLSALARGLGVSVDWLLGNNAERVTVAQLRSEGVPDRYLTPLNVLAASLTDADWVMIVSLVRGLADKNTQQGQQGPQGAVRPAEAEHQAEQAPMGTERRNGWERVRGC